MKIDLQWADNQTWRTLFKLLNEIAEVSTPEEKKEKRRATNSEIYAFVKD